MKYVVMLVTSLLVAGALIATVVYCRRRLARIEEELWGKRK